jgi:hypothetical protein
MVSIWNDSFGIQLASQNVHMGPASIGAQGAYVVGYLSGDGGNYQYSVRIARVAGTGNISVFADGTNPISLLVEDLGA